MREPFPKIFYSFLKFSWFGKRSLLRVTSAFVNKHCKLLLTSPPVVADQYAAEKPGESRSSCTWGAKQTGEFKKKPKRNTARDFPFTPQHMLSRTCSQRNAMVWFVFCFVFTCRMSKMSCRCVLTAVLCVIMLTFREQNNNVKQTLTYRDTRSNLAFIYVSGCGGEKKKA